MLYFVHYLLLADNCFLLSEGTFPGFILTLQRTGILIIPLFLCFFERIKKAAASGQTDTHCSSSVFASNTE